MDRGTLTTQIVLLSITCAVVTADDRGFNNNSGSTTPTPRFSSNGDTGKIMKIITITIGAVGIITNGSVLLVMLKSKQLRRNITNKLILHQSFIDFMAAIFVMFSQIFEDINLAKAGMGVEIFCRVWSTKYFQYALFMTSTNNLIVLTFERYISVFYPKKHLPMFKKKGLISLCILSWIWGFGVKTYMFASSGMVNNKCVLYSLWKSNSARITMMILNTCFMLFVPVLVFLICYGRIIYYLYYFKFGPRNSKQTPGVQKLVSITTGIVGNTAGIAGSLHFNVNQPQNPSKAKVNSLTTLIVIACGFCICWIPDQTYFLVHILGEGKFNTSYTSLISQIIAVLAFCNTIINPFILAIQYRDFQLGVKQLFCKRLDRGLNENDAAMARSYVSVNEFRESFSVSS